MVAPRVCVLRAPGTNCDPETAAAFNLCGGNAESLHLGRLLEQPARLQDYQILCIPGGFSYGDDLGAGVIYASYLQGRLGESLQQFYSSGKLILGICNGFQVLVKSGLLPDPVHLWSKKSPATVTLTWNHNGRYTARWVRVKVHSTKNVFLEGITEIDLPIAHAEGRIVVTSESVANELEQEGQIALKYTPFSSDTIQPASSSYGMSNPNGSWNGIAGLSDRSGRILGLMPHPERFLFGTQHPTWTRRPLQESGAGRQLFQNAINYFL